MTKYSMVPKTYADIADNFMMHPVTGDLTMVYDDASVKQSVKHLVLYNFYEVPFSPWMGGNLVSQLFEPTDPITNDVIKNQIFSVLEQEEPRVQIIEILVKFNEQNNSYHVTIKFKIIGKDNILTLSLILERVR